MSEIVSWNYPTNVIAGAGAISNLVASCKEVGISSPLIVSDRGVASLVFFDDLVSLIGNDYPNSSTFINVDANPSDLNVNEGVNQYRENHHDGVIAIGGGSALDAAKAIALMSGQTLPIWDFEDVGDNWLRVNSEGVAPIIAIPTTAGTGSEVGRASVISDLENKIKKIIFHPKMLPVKVLLDPELTVDLPATLTAATGLDALSHCLEAYCSPFYHPMAEGIAVEGTRLIKNYLLQACNNGNDLEARLNMLVASSMGATAFQKGLGAMHAIAHSIGALYGAHHGLLNAVLMPYVLQENRPEIEEKICRLAKFIELSDSSFNGFIDWIKELRVQLLIPNTLKEIIDVDIDVDKVAEMSLCDPSAGGNPIQFDKRQYIFLINRCVNGDC